MKIGVVGYLTLDVIQKCNLNCDFCMRGNDTGKKITREVVEKIFDEIKYVETIIFTGGEVTLAYNEIKMIIDVMKEKNVKVKKYQIIVNGTIYNEKLFNLLKEEFDKGMISISCDYFHDKSILEKYGDKLDTILNNMNKITKERDFIGFNYLPKRIINTGKAVNIDYIDKEEYSTIGFVTYKEDKNTLYVGPDISIDVEGNFTSGSNTYEINENNSFGNIFEEKLSTMLLKKSIKNMKYSRNRFIKKINNLDKEYFYTNDKKGYFVENRKIVKRKRKVIIAKNPKEDIYDIEKRLIYKYQNN